MVKETYPKTKEKGLKVRSVIKEDYTIEIKDEQQPQRIKGRG